MRRALQSLPILKLLIMICHGYNTRLSASAQGRESATFQVTQDFVFQSIPLKDLVYNPEHAVIVKSIDLSPLSQAINILQDLIDRYNKTCTSSKEKDTIEANNGRFTGLPGRDMTVIKGIDMCKQLGMKLIELRTNADVSDFLSEVVPNSNLTPAGVFYDPRQRSFAFSSDEQPDQLMTTQLSQRHPMGTQ